MAALNLGDELDGPEPFAPPTTAPRSHPVCETVRQCPISLLNGRMTRYSYSYMSVGVQHIYIDIGFHHGMGLLTATTEPLITQMTTQCKTTQVHMAASFHLAQKWRQWCPILENREPKVGVGGLQSAPVFSMTVLDGGRRNHHRKHDQNMRTMGICVLTYGFAPSHYLGQPASTSKTVAGPKEPHTSEGGSQL